MKPVRFQTDAKAEFVAAVEFYEKRRVGLGMEFQAEIEAAVALIRAHPHRFGLYADTVFRKFVVERFPYLVFYWDRNDEIWIMAVAHGRQKPGYWLQRKPE